MTPWQWRPACRLLLSLTAFEIDAGRLDCIGSHFSQSLAAGELEPFVATVAVWDMASKRRVTETLSFETNSSENKRCLGNADTSDELSSVRHVAFEIPQLLPSLMLVVRGGSWSVCEPIVNMIGAVRSRCRARSETTATDCSTPLPKAQQSNPKYVVGATATVDDFGVGGRKIDCRSARRGATAEHALAKCGVGLYTVV